MNRSWILALGLGAALNWAGLVQADDEERKEDGDSRPPAAEAPPRDRDEGPRRGPPEGREAGRREGDKDRGRRARRDDGDDSNRRGPRDGDRDGRRPPPPPREDGDRRGPPPPPREDGDRRGPPPPGGFGLEMAHMERLKQDDPEMFALAKSDMEMEQQKRQLVEQYHRAANDTDRDQIRGKLTAVVENHFAVRQERRELEVKRLEVQLQRLRDSLKKRGEERQKIIERHLSQLLGNDDAGF
jgi:hypothetical protein